MLGINLVTFKQDEQTYVSMKCYLNNFNNSIGNGEYPIESAAKMFEDIQEMTKDLKLTQIKHHVYTTILPDKNYEKYNEVGLVIIAQILTTKILQANKHRITIEDIIKKSKNTTDTTQ